MGGNGGGGVNVAEAQNVQRQLKQQTQRSVCETADSTTVAVNASGNTRGGQRSASQGSQNNPCQPNNNLEKILQQSPQQPNQPILNQPQSLIQPS